MDFSEETLTKFAKIICPESLCLVKIKSNDDENENFFLAQFVNFGKKRVTIKLITNNENETNEVSWKEIFLFVPFNDTTVFSKSNQTKIILSQNFPILIQQREKDSDQYFPVYKKAFLFAPSQDSNKVIIKTVEKNTEIYPIQANTLGVDLPTILRIVPAYKSFPLKMALKMTDIKQKILKNDKKKSNEYFKTDDENKIDKNEIQNQNIIFSLKSITTEKLLKEKIINFKSMNEILNENNPNFDDNGKNNQNFDENEKKLNENYQNFSYKNYDGAKKFWDKSQIVKRKFGEEYHIAPFCLL